MSIDKKKLAYTLEEAAEAIGQSVSTVRRIIANGDLVARYPSRKPVVLATELQEYLESLPTEAP